MPHKTPHYPRRVLLIDDEPSFTRMVKRSLESTGTYVVQVVNESPQSRKVAREFQPDIILLDVVMPEADGGDIATQLRSDPQTKDIPIIFVSAMVSRKESESGFYESGGEHFLAKPVSAKRLTSSIEIVLAKENHKSD